MTKARLDRPLREQVFPTLVGAGVSCLTGWGEVVSAFSGAVNILHRQGLLVSFVQETRAMTTLSVCVSALFQNPKKHPVPGDRVLFDRHRLVTEDVVVVLLGQPTWQGTLTREHVKGFRESKVSLLKKALLMKGKDGGFLGLLRNEETDNPFLGKAREVLRHEVLSDLVGLGPGSTPSGDDFLTGVLLGEQLLSLVPVAEAKGVAGNQKTVIPWPLKKQDLWAALNRTNDAGKTLLWLALQGHFPGYLIDMLRSVSDAEGQEQVAMAVERSLRCGETSGTDALTGFLLFVEGRLRNAGER